MTSKKICLLGKFNPFQGGIPTHNYFLSKEIQKNHDLLIIGYKSFYPPIIRKNKTFNKLNKHKDNEFFNKIQNVFKPYSLYSWKKTFKLILHFNPEIIILPWWYVYLAPSYLYLIKRLVKKNIKIVIMCHNVFLDIKFKFFSNYINSIKNSFIKKVFKKVNYFIVPSEREKKQIQSFHLNPRIIKSLHPVYEFDNSRSTVISKNNNTLRLLFFGYIRKNKGLNILLDALKLVQDQDIFLKIIGKVADRREKKEYLNQINNNNIKHLIEFSDKYVTEQEMSNYFMSSDVVVLPYLEGTSSGVIATAYGYEKPVLISDTGGLPEAVDDSKTGRIVKKNDPLDLANGIKWFIKNTQIDFKTEISDFVQENMSWFSLVNNIIKITNSK